MRTRELLLRTAERLYGQRGINGVSLREIVREAGQRNASAAHYHFGSREGLIAAIFEERMGPIDRQRQKLLDQIEADKTEGDLYRVLETVLSPLVDLMKQSDDAFHYIHFLTEMFLSREFHVDDFVDGKYNHAMRRVYLMTKAHLTDIRSLSCGSGSCCPCIRLPSRWPTSTPRVPDVRQVADNSIWIARSGIWWTCGSAA